MLRLSMVSG